jgi:hypothetical protein
MGPAVNDPNHRRRSRLRRAGVYALILGALLVVADGAGGALGLLHPDRLEWDADFVVLAIGCGLMALANRRV